MIVQDFQSPRTVSSRRVGGAPGWDQSRLTRSWGKAQVSWRHRCEPHRASPNKSLKQTLPTPFSYSRDSVAPSYSPYRGHAEQNLNEAGLCRADRVLSIRAGGDGFDHAAEPLQFDRLVANRGRLSWYSGHRSTPPTIQALQFK